MSSFDNLLLEYFVELVGLRRATYLIFYFAGELYEVE